MASVRFEVRHEFASAPKAVWDALVDWSGHATWVPATRVEVGPGDPTEVGTTFTAFTGYGPLTLEDRMEVVRCDWSEAGSRGDCEVVKVGPTLDGRAGFTVAPSDGGGAVVDWLEDITVPYVPQFIAPVAGRVGAALFGVAMRRLAEQLVERDAG